jgi:thimet oligopeptidase
MLENWCYDREILRKISGHFKDLSKTLPDELLNNILRSKYFLEPLKNRRQLHFGTFDMLAHTAEGKVDSAALWHKCNKVIFKFNFCRHERNCLD